MTARQTVLCLKAFAYMMRSLWGFNVICGKTGHENLEINCCMTINVYLERIFSSGKFAIKCFCQLLVTQYTSYHSHHA